MLNELDATFVFPAPRWPNGDWDPQGLAQEDAWFSSADKTKLHGWFVPAAPASTYVYRNPYAAEPTVPVREYNRTDGTVVLPHHRTPANDTVTDNLNYRGYGTVRVPRYLNGLE